MSVMTINVEKVSSARHVTSVHLSLLGLPLLLERGHPNQETPNLVKPAHLHMYERDGRGGGGRGRGGRGRGGEGRGGRDQASGLNA